MLHKTVANINVYGFVNIPLHLRIVNSIPSAGYSVCVSPLSLYIHAGIDIPFGSPRPEGENFRSTLAAPNTNDFINRGAGYRLAGEPGDTTFRVLSVRRTLRLSSAEMYIHSVRRIRPK